MKCKNYKYKILDKNHVGLNGSTFNKWGNVEDFRNLKAIAIECGKCIECKLKRVMKWKSRLEMEAISNEKNNGAMYFITLTYDDANIYKVRECLLMSEVQKWIKRIRKNNKGLKIKYFGVSELGSNTGREHHHILLYASVDFLERDKTQKAKRINDNLYWNAKNINWPNGYHSVAKITGKKLSVINYLLKYVLKNPLNYFYSRRLGMEEIEKRANKEKGTYMLNGYTYRVPGFKEDKTNMEKIANNVNAIINKKASKVKKQLKKSKELELNG